MLLSISVAILVLTMTIVASFILARHSKSKVDNSFSYFTLLLSFWIAVNYIGANFQSHSYAQYFIHLDFFSGAFVAFGLWVFSKSLLNSTDKKPKVLLIQKRLFVPFFIISLLAGSGTFLPEVIKTSFHSSTTITTYNKFFLAYSIALLILSVASLINIFEALHLARGKLKQQISIMVAGLAAGISFVVISNLLLPIATTSVNANLIAGNLAYIGIALFIAATFYSIVRHKLFDLRLILARAIAYSLSIGTFTAIYVGIAFVISSYLVKGFETSARQLLITIGLMILLVSAVNPLRKFFDKKTNRIFFRDSYDPQGFLDQLNRAVIDNIELGILVERTARVIEDNLKCEHVMFMIYDSSSDKLRCLGTSGAITNIHNTSAIYESLSKQDQKLILYDEIGTRHDELKKLMRDNKLSIATALQTPNHVAKTSNYLIIGDKKSGNIYTEGDIRIIEIIANELVIAIQNALRFEEIQNFNVTLQERINDATRQLRRANEKLKTLDETKDDFISMASHQLRTPLTSIKGYISMVLEGDAGKVSHMQRQMLDQAFFSSQRMVYLIADLLNISRLNTGKFIIEPTKVNLAEVVGQELSQLKETAASHSLTLTYDKPKSFPDLMLDETKTRQVIMNFVDNAIYYTPTKGHIAVHLVDNPSTVELRVEDDGIGVPKSEQPHLFTKFYRAGNARKARPDGTGLGLFMAKKVIAAQGGSIIFESKEGSGSTFGFLFSKAQLKSPKQPPSSVAAKEGLQTSKPKS
jgi:signal transduction histidine kinase